MQKNVINKPIPKNDSLINRDTLAKALYDKLFSWIVTRLNNILLPSNVKMKGEKLILPTSM